MKKKPLEIGILYIGLYSLLKEKFGEGNIVTRKEFFCVLGKHFIVKKNLRPVVIKEMENREFIKRENKEDIRILKSDIDIEDEKCVHEIFKKAGIFSFF